MEEYTERQHLLSEPQNTTNTNLSNSIQSETNRHESTRNAPKRPSSQFHLYLAIVACTMGSPFQIGYNTASLNAPDKIVKEFYNETYIYRFHESIPYDIRTILWAITVASFCIGGMIGGLLSAFLSTRFGRKRVLLWSNLLTFICAGMQAASKYAHSYELLIAGRVIGGVMCGLNSAVAPTYLAEIAPVALRGFCGTCNQLAITSGVFIAEVVGNENVLGTEELWPIILACIAAPGIYSLCTLSWCPESPRYLLVTKGDENAAYQALTWLRGTTDVYEEMEAMKKERIELQNARKFSVTDLWRSPSLRRPLIICLVMQMSNQLCGINAVIYYSTSIFEMANLSATVAQLSTMGTGLTNVLMTFVSALIMDRAGRRTLHLTGLGGMSVFSIILVLCLVFQSSVSWLSYISIACVFIYIIFFATGPGAIPWFIVAEMFEQGPRTAAVSVSVVVNWFCNFLVGLCYPFLQSAIKDYSFLPFSVMLVSFVIFTFLFLPETKGKPISEITKIFKVDSDGGDGEDRTEEERRRLAGKDEETLPLLHNH